MMSGEGCFTPNIVVCASIVSTRRVVLRYANARSQIGSGSLATYLEVTVRGVAQHSRDDLPLCERASVGAVRLPRAGVPEHKAK